MTQMSDKCLLSKSEEKQLGYLDKLRLTESAEGSGSEYWLEIPPLVAHQSIKLPLLYLLQNSPPVQGIVSVGLCTIIPCALFHSV